MSTNNGNIMDANNSNSSEDNSNPNSNPITNTNNNSNYVNEDDVNNQVNEFDRITQKCGRLEAQVSALKEVSVLRKNLLDLREKEVKDLISKLKIFEEAIETERESRTELSMRVETAELRCVELKCKLKSNVEKLSEMRASYEEKLSQVTRELEKSDEDYQKRTDELNDSELRNIDLNTRIDDCNKLIVDNNHEMNRLREEMQVVSERNRVFSYQMNLLNTLFNETEGTPIDFDRIRAIGDIVRESHSRNQSAFSEGNNSNSENNGHPSSFNPTSSRSMNSPTENPTSSSRRTSIDYSSIIDHIDVDKYTDDIPGEESCYKKVATIHGPQLVLSVSQTFIKLKDLILEKKSLQREIESLKQLHVKLESKVDRQERRLFSVTSELNKTWNLVAKLKMQHDKLHNSEAVLKYELHEKRKLLERLKTDLSVSRQQWAKVRQKNNESEILCQRMRAEFARRRLPLSQHSSSQESGAFSQASPSPCSSSTEDEDVETEEGGQRPKPKPEALASVADTVTLRGDGDEDNERDETANDINSGSGSGLEDGEEEGEEEEIRDYDEVEMDVDPLEELVSDLVEEIEAVASAEDASLEIEHDPGVDDDVFHRNRANRLRRLEDASRVLYSRLMATTVQGSTLASRLAQLHDHYGSHDGAPPGTESFEFDEITMETTSSADVAYASVLQNPNSNTADDTEIDSQFEDTPTSPGLTNHLHNSNPLLSGSGSVDMIPEDMPTLNSEFQDVTTMTPTTTTIPNPALTSSNSELHNSPTATVSPNPSPNNSNFHPPTILSIPVVTMTQNAEALLINVDMEGQENLAELAVPRAASPSPLLVLSTSTATSTQVFTNNEHMTGSSGGGEHLAAAGMSANANNDTDPNSLSRLIIQQVPKRLEILKQQNCSMKDREHHLRLEMEEQKKRMERLEMENQKINERLHEEIQSKETAIATLHTDIADLVSSLKTEKETLSSFVKTYLEEKSDMESPQPKQVPSASSDKHCHKCEKKFSIWRRRKQQCSICKLNFCRDCTSTTASASQSTSAQPGTSKSTTSTKQKPCCSTCHDRRVLLETTAQSLL